MTELKGTTLDITEENIKALGQIFPEAVEEGKIDFDVLRQLLGDYVDDAQERYSFKWNGKGQALRISQTPSTGTLRPCKEESKDWDKTQNIYIEGDNLEVLKLLQKSYYGKIKMIYIDPPYNTGSDFVYKDDFKDNIENYKKITGQVDEEGRRVDTNTESSGRLHTNWLNMMYPRLRLARNLLSDDGVIFISIDDNEQENLIKICNEIYGEVNHLGCLTWMKKTKPINSGDAKYQLQSKIEYIHVYCKEKNTPNTYKFLLETSGKRVYDFETSMGLCRLKDIEDSDYGTKARDTMKFPILGITPPPGKRWKIGFDECQKLIDTNRIKVINGKVKVLVYPEDESSDIKKPFWSWLGDSVGSAENGKSELNNLLENNVGFETVKPIGLIEEIIKHMGNDIYILDFFSGSSSTAHAIIDYNAHNSCNCKFILVQIPEMVDEQSDVAKAGYSNICELGKDRIRRAGEKIKSEMEDKGKADKLDIGFKVFKLDSSNIKKWNMNSGEVEELSLELEGAVNHIVEGRSEMDVVYEIMLKMGLDISYSIEERDVNGTKIYVIGGGALMICLASDVDIDVAKGIVDLYEEYEPEVWQVVFGDMCFKDDMTKTNIKETLRHGGLDEDSFVCV